MRFDIQTKYTLETQRFVAAIQVCFLWVKVFDWLRLFDGTAFYIRLIFKTADNTKYFLIIMLIWYMMFGCAVYILSLGLPPEESIMESVFGFWVLDAFQG